jgi:hypothetical protein
VFDCAITRIIHNGYQAGHVGRSMNPAYELNQAVTWNDKKWQVRGRTIWHTPPLYDLAELGLVSKETAVKFAVPEEEISV